MISHFMHEESGIMTFEWILLITLVVIGCIVGITAIRDATTCELTDISTVTMALEQSYGVGGVSGTVSGSLDGGTTAVNVAGTISGMSYNNGPVTVPKLQALAN